MIRKEREHSTPFDEWFGNVRDDWFATDRAAIGGDTKRLVLGCSPKTKKNECFRYSVVMNSKILFVYSQVLTGVHNREVETTNDNSFTRTF